MSLALEQFLSRNLRLSASGYRYEIKDLISLRRDPVDKLMVFRNVDRVRALGVELELEGRYAHGLLARVSYALQIARDDKTGRELNDSPRHLAKLNLGLRSLVTASMPGSSFNIRAASRPWPNTGPPGSSSPMPLFSAPGCCPPGGRGFRLQLVRPGVCLPGIPGLAQDVIPQDGRSWRVKGTYKF